MSNAGQILIYDDEDEWRTLIKEHLSQLNNYYDLIDEHKLSKALSVIVNPNCVLAILNIYQKGVKNEIAYHNWLKLANTSYSHHVPIMIVSGIKSVFRSEHKINNDIRNFNYILFRKNRNPYHLLSIGSKALDLIRKSPVPLNMMQEVWLINILNQEYEINNKNILIKFIKDAEIPIHYVDLIKKQLKYVENHLEYTINKFNTINYIDSNRTLTCIGLILRKIYQEINKVEIETKCFELISVNRLIFDPEVYNNLKKKNELYSKNSFPRIKKEKIINNYIIFHEADFHLAASIASSAMCRIEESLNSPIGTGFLITHSLILTCAHNVPEDDTELWARFLYKKNIRGQLDEGIARKAIPYKIHNELGFDFCLLKLESPIYHNEINPIDLTKKRGKAKKGEKCFMFQHPKGEPLKSVFDNNAVFKKRTGIFQYHTCDTMEGASGSPIFNRHWDIVALHIGTFEGNLEENVGILIQPIYEKIKDYLK